MLNIGVDTGGTFTDFVVFDDANTVSYTHQPQPPTPKV